MNTAILHVNITGPSRDVLKYIADNKKNIPLKWEVRKHPNIMDSYERDLLNKVKITKIPAMELAGDVFNSSAEILRCLRKLQTVGKQQPAKVINNRQDILSGVKYEKDDKGRKKIVIDKEDDDDNFEKEIERKKREFKTPAHWGVSMGGTDPEGEEATEEQERDVDITAKQETTDDGVIDNEWFMRNIDD